MGVTATIIGGKMHLSGNPIRVEVETTGIPVGANNYKILLKVTPVYDMVVKGGPFIDGIAPNSEGKAAFDIHGLVDVPIPITFNYPVQNTVTGYTNRTIDLQVQPGESWIDDDDELHETWGEASDTFFAIKGGVNEQVLSGWYEAGTDFEKEFVDNGKFLTNLPRQMTVLPNQYTKLCMIFPRGDAFDAVKTLTATYSDGSTETSEVAFTVYTDALYEFDFHLPTLGIPVMEGTRKAISYEVCIGGNGSYSETFRFVIDWQYYEDPVQLFYLNSPGGIDCVSLTGNVETGFESGMVESVLPLKSNATPKDRTVIVASRTGARVWKVNTGWKDKATMEAIADMLVSKHAWILYKGELLPVSVTNQSTPLVDKNSNLQSAEITLRLAHNSAYI